MMQFLQEHPEKENTIYENTSQEGMTENKRKYSVLSINQKKL